MNYKFIEELEEDYMRIDGELYFYSATWKALKAEQKRQKKEGGDDVRAAGYVLEQLGIYSVRQFADDSNEKGWIIYWA